MLPTNNPFFKYNAKLIEEAHRILIKGVASEVDSLCMPQDHGPQQVHYYLGNINKRLRGAQEFGVEGVKVMDEEIFPQLAEAIIPYQRAGIRSEIHRIMTDILTTCGIPASALEK